MDKLYSIEVHDEFTYSIYRWRSNVNGACGPWVDEREDAVEAGEEHHNIMLSIYPELREQYGQRH